MITGLEIFLLFVGLICLYYSYKLNKLLKSTSKNSFMTKEANRIVFEDAKVDHSYSSEGRVYCRGLALIKSENGKYTLVPQAKVCDIGLY